MNLVDAATVGLAQALAVVPGTSRSGITITAGLFRDINREAAARFSFLLSTPAIAAAAAKALYDLKKHHGGIPHEMVVPGVVGAVVSAVVGAIVIKFLLDYLPPARTLVLHLLPDCFRYHSNRSGRCLPLQRGMNILVPPVTHG